MQSCGVKDKIGKIKAMVDGWGFSVAHLLAVEQTWEFFFPMMFVAKLNGEPLLLRSGSINE